VSEREVLVRDAATVMLVRDGAPRDDIESRVEVFMLQRHRDSAFLGGAYVFPGGAVDEHDRHADLEAVCAGRTDAVASALLGLDPPTGGLAFWVAGIREAFEEAGVLLAYGPDGAIVDWSDPSVAARFAEHRKAVDTGERRLVDICRDEGLQLAADTVHYFSHWITPVGPPRRFDTRFFVARAPEGHTYLHDERETIDNAWVRPAEAIERQARGEVDIIFPTLRTLQTIIRFDTTDELLTAAAAAGDIPTMLPRVVKDADGTRILLPGDEGYDDGTG
jgi:8-oxo-dGTP pyrophosphatase MutT (NUDIX family)